MASTKTRWVKMPDGSFKKLVDGQWVDFKPTKAEQVERQISNKAETVKEERKPVEAVDFDLGTMASNIPSSAMKYGEDIATMLWNPIDTAEGLGKAAIGGVQKLIPGQAEPDAMIPNYEPVADAVGEHFAGRYGSLDQFKATAMEDPVGVLGDVAGVASGIGMLPKAGKIGQLGSLLDPANLAIRGGSKAISNMPGVKGAPAGLYASSAKIPTKFDESAVVNTALERGIMPTPSGLAKADGIITALNDKLTKLIDASSQSGEYVSSSVVFKSLDDVRQELGGFKRNAPDDLVKLDADIVKFQKYLDEQGMDFVTIKELQEFKTDLYKRVKYDRKQNVLDPVDEAVSKNLAKSAKETIEEFIPEAKDLNLEMGEMIKLVEALEQPSARIGRRDILGLGTASKTTAGAVTAGVPGAITGFLVGLADNPSNKARLALGIQKIKKQNISMAKKRVLAMELIRNEVARQQEEQ